MRCPFRVETYYYKYSPEGKQIPATQTSAERSEQFFADCIKEFCPAYYFYPRRAPDPPVIKCLRVQGVGGD